MKKVLMITYVFPPAAWVGAHRTLKYCKYLGPCGWTPVVLTAKPLGVAFQDASLLRQIPPEVAVHRTFDLDPAKWEERLGAWKARRARQPSPNPGTPQPAYEPAPARGGLLRGVKTFVKALLKESPDSHLFWVPFAFFRGLWVLATDKVDVIYCSSPPHSSHLAAYLLAKCARKPYVLDFRDPWYVQGSAKPPEGKIPMLLRLETWTKRRIVRSAARIICVSKGEMDELRAEFPELPQERFTYITNGYDPSDLPTTQPPATRTGPLTLIHAGTVYFGVADELFAALKRLLAEDPAVARAMQVHMLGEIAHDYLGTVRELEDGGILKAHGLLPHAQALERVQASHVALILMGGTKYLPSHLPSKVFEYLHAEKPILAVAVEGELAELARKSGLGIVVPPRSTDALVHALRRLIADHAAGNLSRVPNQSYIRGFERSALAERLARVLDAVAAPDRN